MKLSILICTMPSRSEMLKKLTQQLMLLLVKYDESEWEVLIQPDENINVGKKRNILLQKASGDFIVFIDDDDEIHDNYIDAFMNAIESNPDADCIGYRGYITFDGSSRKDWVISKECETWHEKDGVYYVNSLYDGSIFFIFSEDDEEKVYYTDERDFNVGIDKDYNLSKRHFSNLNELKNRNNESNYP